MVKRTKQIAFLVLIGMILLMVNLSFARGPVNKGRSLQLVPTGSGFDMINVGNWNYWVWKDGRSANISSAQGGGIFPALSAGVVYQDGFIWGGYVGDPSDPANNLRIGGQMYSIGTVPGWVENGVPVDPNDSRNGVYAIRADWRSLRISDETSDLIPEAAMYYQKSTSEVTLQDRLDLLEEYKADWKDWPVELGAPYFDADHDGAYNPVLDSDGYPYTFDPNTGDELDHPGYARADMVVWFVVNDMNQSTASLFFGTDPMGMELQVTLWAYNQPSTALGNIVFKSFKLINRSTNNVTDMYVGEFVDPDVGSPANDLVGCDPDFSLGFAYNATASDDEFLAFNKPPAAVGYDFFQGPLVPGDPTDTAIFELKKVPGYKNLPMHSFGYFAAGATYDDPRSGEGDFNEGKRMYNLLRGYAPTPDLDNPEFYLDNQGNPTFFPLSGDPLRGTGDLDGRFLSASDRRMMLCTGPFTMAPGDTQEIVMAVVGGIIDNEDGNNLNAIAQMKVYDQTAQFLYDNLFAGIPTPPASPNVNAYEKENSIVLNWGSDLERVALSEQDDPILGFNFQGYNVYQLPSESASLDQAVKIATFDKVDLVTVIYGQKFDANYGDVLTVPLQQGSDSGIKRYIEINRDYLNDRPLYPGNKYYFAVTAYNYVDNPLVPVPTLESQKAVVTVIPQKLKPGTILGADFAQTVEVTKNNTSTGDVSVTVVDPYALTGHAYKVGFHNEASYNIDALGDTLGVYYQWYLVDVTAGDTLLQRQDDLSGGDNSPIVDGFQVKVSGPKAPGLADWDYTGTRWVSGVNWGGAQFFGGMDVGYNFFGSTLGDADLVPINIKFFADTTAGPADGWASKGAVYNRSAGYAHEGAGYLPMAAYDIIDPANPRQTNICFVESGNHNHRWDMGGWDGSAYADPDLGGREYTFFMKSSYDEGAQYDDTNWGPSADVLYAIWPHQRGSHPYLEADFEMNIYANLPNTPTDEFTWTTAQSIVSESKKKDDVEKINVFPNPYYGHNTQAEGQFDEYITFTHLPEHAIIRIFNVAGEMVKKIEKNDASTQFQQWDLTTDHGLPVASGLYLAHIDMPELGKKKVVKFFIVQREQILRYF